MESWSDGSKRVSDFKPFMSKNPVVYYEHVNQKRFSFYPTENDLAVHFPLDKKKNIKTWGDARKEKAPHWIALSFRNRRIQPLHVDSKYPRYTHHLKVRCDNGIAVQGLSKQPMQLHTGSFYILDTHSPHQVICLNDSCKWNVAVSIDSHEILDPEYAINLALSYATKESFYAGTN